MQRASKAQTVGRTARLTGFENQKDTHRCSLSPCVRDPSGSRLYALGQPCGGLEIREPHPPTASALTAGAYRLAAELSMDRRADKRDKRQQTFAELPYLDLTSGGRGNS